jgi:O-antigen ligase
MIGLTRVETQQSGKYSLLLAILLAASVGLLVVILSPLYAAALAVTLALAYFAIRRPHWVVFALLLTKASLDNLSQTVTFFEDTAWSVNVNGLLNVAIVLLAVVVVVGRYVSIRKLPATRPYLVLLAIGLLGLIVSSYRTDTIREWFRLASPLAIYTLVAGVARRRPGIGWLITLIALSAVVPFAVGLYQAVSGTGSQVTAGFNRAYSTFWFPAGFAFYLLIVLMLAIPQLKVSQRFWRQVVFAGLIGLCELLLLLTYVRAAWAGMLLAVGLFGLFYSRKLLFIGIIGVLIVVLTVPAVTQRFADLRTPDTFSSGGGTVGPASALGASNSFQWRLALWGDTLSFAVAHPWVGNGLGSFANLAALTRVGLKIAAHNDYLRILVEMGVMGLLVFLWLHLSVLRGAWRVYRQRRPAWQSAFALAFIGLYLAILLVSFTDNVLSYHTVGWYVWAYAAVVHQL